MSVIVNNNDNQRMSDGSINRKFVNSMIKVSTFMLIYFYFQSSSLHYSDYSLPLLHMKMLQKKRSEIDLLNENKIAITEWIAHLA